MEYKLGTNYRLKIAVYCSSCRTVLLPMSSPKEGRKDEPSRVDVPLQSRLSKLSIEEGYFARPQAPSTPERPSSTDLPASLALPLARTRSTTPQISTPLRVGPSVSVDDDGASIRSFVPTVAGGEDLEAMLSEMLGADARWRLEQDEDIDAWEGQSDGESDTESTSSEDPEDDG